MDINELKALSMETIIEAQNGRSRFKIIPSSPKQRIKDDYLTALEVIIQDENTEVGQVISLLYLVHTSIKVIDPYKQKELDF